MNKCQRCNKPLITPNASYGWRCAQILGIDPLDPRVTGRIWQKIDTGVKKAESMIKNSPIQMTEKDKGDAAKVIDKAGDAVDAAKTVKLTSVSDNFKEVSKKYPLNEKGLFGRQGKSCRVIDCDDQYKTADDFYKSISKGGIEAPLDNGKGLRVDFDDGSIVTYRVNTSTPNSPAVEITIENQGTKKIQKIHFERK